MAETKKPKRRSTLLSRMKNRNRTAPLTIPAPLKASELHRVPAALAPLRFTSLPTLALPLKSHTEHHGHLPHPLKSLVLEDSLMAEQLDQEGEPLAHPFSPLLPAVTQTIVLQGLPDLPRARAALPPIQGHLL